MWTLSLTCENSCDGYLISRVVVVIGCWRCTVRPPTGSTTAVLFSEGIYLYLVSILSLFFVCFCLALCVVLFVLFVWWFFRWWCVRDVMALLVVVGIIAEGAGKRITHKLTVPYSRRSAYTYTLELYACMHVCFWSPGLLRSKVYLYLRCTEEGVQSDGNRGFFCYFSSTSHTWGVLYLLVAVEAREHHWVGHWLRQTCLLAWFMANGNKDEAAGGRKGLAC